MIITRQLAEISDVTEHKKYLHKDIQKDRRIGLALSGGGFRAAIFHLGVIRRLEELGIMQQVKVISAVSGGSIIAAYYLCEMEQRLHREPLANRTKRDVRMRIFEEIAEDFLSALDKNLCNRALFFTPFYHPWLFIKSILLKPFRASARSILIQKEYDKWFYKEYALDQLPSTSTQDSASASDLSGTKLLLNTTSMLTGERVTFSREPVSSVNEMSRVNRNILPISSVVGASSGVPALFPPTMIAGDVLVDGGVADNQGIESLLADPAKCNVLLVSDASGQMEPVHTISRGAVSIFARVNSVLQFQIRNKLIDILVGWKHMPAINNESYNFAFIHLFLNLKDRQATAKRVASEFIPALGRIRTDLDQFSYIEREALMYHGYTLIDSQLRKYCGEVLSGILSEQPADTILTPPLFNDAVLDSQKKVFNSKTPHEVIRTDLEAGSQNIYFLRCMKKYPWGVAPIIAAGVVIAALCMALLFLTCPALLHWLQDLFSATVLGIIPTAAVSPVNYALKYFGLLDLATSIQGLAGIAVFLLLLLLILYLVGFPVYVIVRRYTAALDYSVYKKLTGVSPSTHWGKTKQQ
jgi:predicted acylesterase/phospholipase RssA